MSERDPRAPLENDPQEPGAEGGADSEDFDALPGQPTDNPDAPLGDTDQHSDANA